jgi:hypothetical protein
VAYFANGLTDPENQQLEQHLANCPKCRLALSEAYSGFRLASAAFNAPDADRGLNAARLGVIYAAAARGTVPVAPEQRSAPGRAWFAAAACAVIAAAAWLGQIEFDPASAELSTQVAAAAPAPEPDHAPPPFQYVDYPASLGIIYPANYRAAGGYTPDNRYATVMIDYYSVWDQSLFIYDPAYGLGRTVITDGSRSTAHPVTVEYGLGGPNARVRL